MSNTLSNRRISLGMSSNYSKEAKLYFGTLSVQPSSIQKLRLDRFLFRPLVATGIYSQLDRLWVFASETQANGLVSLVNPTATLVTEVNSPTWVQYQGYDFNGTTQYLNSQTNLSTLTKYQLDSATTFLYSRQNNTSSGADFGSTGAAAAQNTAQWLRFTDNKMYWSMNDTGAASNVANTDSSGGFQVSRTGSTALTIYRNGSSIATDTEVSTTVGSQPPYIGALNGNGTAVSFCNRQLSVVAIGSGNINASIFYSIIQNYMIQVGANV